MSISDIFDLFLEDDKIVNKEEWEDRIKEWFLLLSYRVNRFKEFYPFQITKKTINLKKTITKKHKLYIYLLLLSLQKYLKKDKNILTSEFEYLSKVLLNNYLCNSEIYNFGKSMIYTEFNGSLKDKVDKLSYKLGYSTKYKEKDIKNNNGDGGLDIIAWTPFKNDKNLFNIQMFLCQCATGKEWFKKSYDIDRFTSNFIIFETIVIPTLIIPYDIRDFDNDFYSKVDIKTEIILIDRIRLLSLIKDENIINELKSKNIIDNIIQYEEDIV